MYRSTSVARLSSILFHLVLLSQMIVDLTFSPITGEIVFNRISHHHFRFIVRLSKPVKKLAALQSCTGLKADI